MAKEQNQKALIWLAFFAAGTALGNLSMYLFWATDESPSLRHGFEIALTVMGVITAVWIAVLAVKKIRKK